MANAYKRPAEVIAEQQDLIADLDRMIELLKGALAAAGIERPPAYRPWMKGLTPQERGLLGALYSHYPNPVDKHALLEHMPGQDHVEDRQVQLVALKVHHLRGKLGHDAIESIRGLGYRLSAAEYHAMREAEGAAVVPFKVAA
ncbi:winged helix-turn-helix domain-containing protein [Phenylobacterium sp. SCN 70-31]|uniref:winged helix-turn-helix domain-containing protein n=1 Tax=Phenylobacterium sp. SCN 70-31 TaxID=1660129 RepID=UPI00086D07E7|nr:winged helix-turn-helix domain-containing protein [Phenylobacterium sp. SCN 70-31]ODT89884.1 MAG: hypothetical protein ABS78_00675 [Phenylobacterium sp. SCN 70-31]